MRAFVAFAPVKPVEAATMIKIELSHCCGAHLNPMPGFQHVLQCDNCHGIYGLSKEEQRFFKDA